MDTIKNITDRAKSMNRSEGRTTETIEKVTAGIPSATWLVLAGGSIVAALALKLMGRSSTANFVGEWAPTFLMIGLYTKVVKVLGGDRQEVNARA